MIDQKAAREIVESFLRAHYPVPGDEPVLGDELTIEKEYGWIFFYDSKRYIETEDHRYALAGNGPILVEREAGAIRQFGTARPLEHYLAAYESERKGKR